VLVLGAVIILILGLVDVVYHGHFSDGWIKARAEKQIVKGGWMTKERPITVTVMDNEVTLEGFVPTFEDKGKVSDAIQRKVPGVVKITNNLIPLAAYCDQQILEQLKVYVDADPSEAAISYLVDPGCNITLTGWVPTEEMSKAVFTVADSIPGKGLVTNNIEVGFATQKVHETLVEVLRMNNVYFDHGQVRPREKSVPALDKVAKVLKDNPGSRIRIEAHTDNVGPVKDNQALTEKRAKAIQEELVKRGVEANRLDIAGFGESKPIATNETTEGRAENNRIEFKVP